MGRAETRLVGLSDHERQQILEETLYEERRRLESKPADSPERIQLEKLSKALVRGIRGDQIQTAVEMVAEWTHEIHGRFSPRVYRMATQVAPKALTSLLTARPRRFRDFNLDIERRLNIHGSIPHVHDLIREGTVVLVPTHVSNLDSPLIGLSLYLSGLPPFVYGAGLNLFSNPILGWWLRRLGAYTVDRRKRAPLYKDALKDYSLQCLTHGYHSLFFPGGTRSRSGEIESHIKKGLLGTTITAWQENLRTQVRPRPIFIVPVTLTFQMVLEAATLIEDHLTEHGKQRYIIDDDEFSQPAQVASFTRRMLELDASITVHFGQPLDCLGFPVSADPAERHQEASRRLRFVCDRNGDVQLDPQRDRVYTDRLAKNIVAEYPKGTTVFSTHLAAWAAWSVLCDQLGYSDPYRVVRTAAGQRAIGRTALTKQIEKGRQVVLAGSAKGSWRHHLPQTSEEILEESLDRFSRYHKTRALNAHNSEIIIEDPRLCLYYRNRLLFLNEEV